MAQSNHSRPLHEGDVQVARSLLSAGTSDEKLLAALAYRGVDPTVAAGLVADLRAGRSPVANTGGHCKPASTPPLLPSPTQPPTKSRFAQFSFVLAWVAALQFLLDFCPVYARAWHGIRGGDLSPFQAWDGLFGGMMGRSFTFCVILTSAGMLCGGIAFFRILVSKVPLKGLALALAATALSTSVLWWMSSSIEGLQPRRSHPALSNESKAAGSVAVSPLTSVSPKPENSPAPVISSPRVGNPRLPTEYVTLPSIQLEAGFGANGAVFQAEPLALYRVPVDRAAELRSDLEAVAAATNVVLRLREQLASIRQALQQDTRDYLTKIKETGEGGESQRAALMQKLLDLQAQGASRRQDYLQEISSLRASLQDPLPVLDQKLIRKQQADLRYQNDLAQLDAATSRLQQEIYAAGQGLRQSRNLAELAYRQASESGLQSLTNVGVELREQVSNLNGLIGNYNTKLKLYGSLER